jgi:hypothetical protein
MRTALQEASSLARTLVLRRAVPQRIERQRVNKPLVLVIESVLVRQIIVRAGVFLHRDQHITQRGEGKSEL